MAEFSVRVELHGAEGKDYRQLHDAMDDEGFDRFITITKTGEKLELPTAEYNFISETHTDQEVHNLVAAAVKTALKDNLAHIQHLNNPPMIVVAKTSGRYVSGLKAYTPKMRLNSKRK